MADNLICLDFYGLPGSGKTVISHKIAGDLRGRGYCVEEASYRIDSKSCRLARIVVKTWYSVCLMMGHSRVYKAISRKVRECGYKGLERFVQKVNLLYKFHYLLSLRSGVLVFDEGIVQSCISLSALGKKPARELFDFFREFFPQMEYQAIKIDSSIEKALENMASRQGKDSRVERLEDHSDRTRLLALMQKEVESFDDICSDVLSKFETNYQIK